MGEISPSEDAPVSQKVFDGFKDETNEKFQKVFKQLEEIQQTMKSDREEREEERKNNDRFRNYFESMIKQQEEAMQKRQEREELMQAEWDAGNYLAYFLILSSINAGNVFRCYFFFTAFVTPYFSSCNSTATRRHRFLKVE